MNKKILNSSSLIYICILPSRRQERSGKIWCPYGGECDLHCACSYQWMQGSRPRNDPFHIHASIEELPIDSDNSHLLYICRPLVLGHSEPVIANLGRASQLKSPPYAYFFYRNSAIQFLRLFITIQLVLWALLTL